MKTRNDTGLLRTNTELSKSTEDKEMMKELLVEEQTLTRQLQEDGRKQQAVVEELLRKDLWNREQKLLRGSEKEQSWCYSAFEKTSNQGRRCNSPAGHAGASAPWESACEEAGVY